MAPQKRSSALQRRDVLTAGAGLATLGIAGCLGTALTSMDDTSDFEDGLGDWERNADVPDDPNNPGNPVEWSITTSTDQAATGQTSVRYLLDGLQDDGTIWLVKPLEVSAGQSYSAEVTAQAWSQSQSFNTLAHLVMYLGPERPTGETDFPDPNTNSSTDAFGYGGLREPLNRSAGWEEYAFSWETPTFDTDTVYIAVGISAVWESHLGYYVDDISITFDS